MIKLKNNLESIISRIEKAQVAYSRHQIIELVAVSKYNTVEDIQALYTFGQQTFGENKVQDLKTKSEILNELPLQWHMIGPLQENKINALLALKPALLQSLDSLKLAFAIQKRCERDKIILKALLQVNSAEEKSKSGVRPQECLEVYHHIIECCPNIKLMGLMSIGAHSDEHFKIDQSFKITKNLFDSLHGAKILSMGMSGDFEIAIANGANMLRIGSILFQKK